MSERDTLHRQWAMLSMIPRVGYITSADLTRRLRADGFSVTQRTVQRDLQALSGLFPLDADEREQTRGWRWAKNAAPLDIPGMSPSAALTLVLAREHLQPLMPRQLLDSLSEYFRQAERTLTSPGSHAAFSDWSEKVATVAPSQPLIPPPCEDAVVAAVHEALLTERQLEVKYESRAGGAGTARIHPLALVVRGSITYLVALYFDYDDPRILALHRIKAATVLDKAGRRVPGFNLRAYIASGAFGFGDGTLIRLEARFDQHAAAHLSESRLSEDQTIGAPRKGWVTVRATVVETEQLRWWLLAFGDQVEVRKPAQLREFMRRTAAGTLALYQASEAHGGEGGTQ